MVLPLSTDRSDSAEQDVLAGVPYAAKNLFDVQGEATLAGSKINQNRVAATQDAFLVTHMQRAGAVLVGGLLLTDCS
jgi:Asp-tRNA(Asn)/Glu-tRNA(Gln) amidotransferase A subunit family amidase